ncbi:MAG: ABC transporter ATP-binding protein [Nitrososphaerota archaeon]|nr:ABC transporter ATP-binding protein [Nitrososphaerota archaeon]
MDDFALQATSLSKSFGPTRAVDGISIAMKKGEILGLLGPNGSGKSTTMKLILGILKPDSGSIVVGGIEVTKDPVGVKKIVGYVPETPQTYEFLTGLEYLDFIADMYDIPHEERKARISQFLEGLQMAGHENEMIGGYSQGMKQKIAIIAALMHRPKILVMDEALNGLDPRSAKLVKDLLRNLANEGISVLFSTHVLEIAEALCDDVAIMYQGKVVASGTMADLRSQAGLPGSTLEEVFLKITGTGELDEIVRELSK